MTKSEAKMVSVTELAKVTQILLSYYVNHADGSRNYDPAMVETAELYIELLCEDPDDGEDYEYPASEPSGEGEVA